MESLLPALTGALGDSPDAITIAGESTSWEQLAAASDAVALQCAGANALAVTATPRLDTVVAILGGLRAGIPVVPIAPDSGPVERDNALATSEVDLVYGMEAGDRTVITADPRATTSLAVPIPATDRTALVLATSGTTGLPKGVPITPAMMAACLDGLADAWQWSRADHLVHGLPLFHVHGLILGVLGALRVGSRLTHTGRPRPEAYAAVDGSLYFGVPTVWGRIAEDPAAARALAGARLLVSGSAPLPVPVIDRMRGLSGLTLIERYGMTETLITLSMRLDRERQPGTVGFRLAGVETRLTDDSGAMIASDGETSGNLEVRGRCVFDGYLNRPDATAEAFGEDGWFATGDLATIDGDGVHRILGRASVDLIKCGGYRIGAGEVEHVLLGHPGIREAAVVGAPHTDLGQEVVAYLVARGDAPTEAEVIDWVATQLSIHKRPRRVIFLDELPRNAMGKISKKSLMGQ